MSKSVNVFPHSRNCEESGTSEGLWDYYVTCVSETIHTPSTELIGIPWGWGGRRGSCSKDKTF